METVQKCWGEEEILCSTPLYTGKYLYVKAGYKCSEHRHLVKDETFICVGGSGVICVNGNIAPFQEGDRQRLFPGEWHWFASVEGMTLLEVSTHHSDADVERRSESRELKPSDYVVYEAAKSNGITDRSGKTH